MKESKASKHKKIDQKVKRVRKTLFQGKIIKLHVDRLACSDNAFKNFELVEHPGAVAVLPIRDDGKLMLIKQYRHAIQKILIEVPAGCLERGEKIKDCAQRELREEIGFSAKTFILLGNYFSTPGFSTEVIHIYVAKGLKKDPLICDDDEGIDLFPTTLKEALKLLENNKIYDLKTVAAILMYKGSL